MGWGWGYGMMGGWFGMLLPLLFMALEGEGFFVNLQG
ncbi:hypothetical protein Desca_1632 [Desulfotomaculum nigrificans CO-1-SRB]|uniref:Uncharacterized protein n=1 Tax=Desulfotomaculum nigrificans (strain DSM 14880 / VKM B-2319 / CO-1-SRB) TaxID=868595 RepID=F6B755_DESCC|nr:hypothetical protein Desca_1632 [Desulfotomaculum nigrificans CO-1-SRB]